MPEPQGLLEDPAVLFPHILASLQSAFLAWPMSRSFWTIQRPRNPSLPLKSSSRSYFLLGLKPGL